MSTNTREYASPQGHTFVFTPHAVGRGEIVYSGEILELAHRSLTTWDPQLMLELPGGGDFDSQLVRFHLFFLKVIQGMRTTGVGPHIRERDLLRSSLLEEQLTIGGSEYESRECTVQQAFVDILHQVT